MDRTLGWTTPMVVTKYICAIYLVGVCVATMAFGMSLPVMLFFIGTLVCLVCAQASSGAQMRPAAQVFTANEKTTYCQDAHCPCETHHTPMVYIEGDYEYGDGVWQPTPCRNSNCGCAYHQRTEVLFNGTEWATRDGSLWSGYCYDRYCFCNQHQQARRFDITQRQWLYKNPCNEEYCVCWWHQTPRQQFSGGQWQQCS